MLGNPMGVLRMFTLQNEIRSWSEKGNNPEQEAGRSAWETLWEENKEGPSPPTSSLLGGCHPWSILLDSYVSEWQYLLSKE